MYRVSQSKISQFSPKQLFDLVNDVDEYSKFIPNCVESGILEKTKDSMNAYIDVEKLGTKKRIITKNTFVENEYIYMDLIEGPMSNLTGKWHFMQLSENQTQIEFELRFTFKNKFLELIFRPLLTSLANDMINAFTKRAKQIYLYEN